MTHLRDIIDETQLIDDYNAGYIRAQFHPEFPYCILNYTEKAQYESHWTDATVTCRGLIYNTETDEIVARPFPKFFNYSQLTNPPTPDTRLQGVSDKMDGSLGIIYRGPDGSTNVATRGSFTSEQALWATEWIQARPHVYPRHSFRTTLLVEIIYPQNRIVVSYGDRESLVLLGGVSMFDGTVYNPERYQDAWYGDVTETFSQYETLADVLDAPNRDNAEGLVALTEDGDLIKFKQEDYIALHRILTGLTERTVYDVLVTDGNVDRLIEIVPDEFHPWVTEVARRLAQEYEGWMSHWHHEYNSIMFKLSALPTQKEFALEAVQTECKAAMFLIHKGDQKKLAEMAWKEVRPPATMATAAQREQEETA